MKTSLRAPTTYERERFEAMMRLGCVCCASLGIPYAMVEAHHLLEGGRRMGHFFSLPLCAGHHRGEFTMLQRELIPESKLVSISSGTKRFNRVYGTQRELWEKIQRRLGLSLAWPISKIMRRPHAENAERVADIASREVPSEALQPEGAGSPGGDGL